MGTMRTIRIGALGSATLLMLILSNPPAISETPGGPDAGQAAGEAGPSAAEAPEGGGAPVQPLEDVVPREIRSADGTVVAIVSDGAAGLPADSRQALTELEQRKIEMARAAIAAAEAAGTREIRREDRAIVSPEQAEASKLERLANQAPQIIVPRPGTDEAGAMQVTTPDSTAGGEEEGR